MQETAQERRRRKLAWLCEKLSLGKVAELSGVHPAYLDQIIKGVLLPAKEDGTRNPRGLGNAKARAIETTVPGLYVGWFDAPDEQPKLSDDATKYAMLYDRMNETEQQRFRLLLIAARDAKSPTIIAPPDDPLNGKDAIGDSGLTDLEPPPPPPKKRPKK